jgi:hypothetical protein
MVPGKNQRDSQPSGVPQSCTATERGWFTACLCEAISTTACRGAGAVDPLRYALTPRSFVSSINIGDPSCLRSKSLATSHPAPLMKHAEPSPVSSESNNRYELNSSAIEEAFAIYRFCFSIPTIMCKRNKDVIRHRHKTVIRNCLIRLAVLFHFGDVICIRVYVLMEERRVDGIETSTRPVLYRYPLSSQTMKSTRK